MGSRPTLISLTMLLFGVVAISGCMGRHEPPQLVVPLSTEAAISSPSSPGIGVRLTFNGETAWFLFDTGAGAHTLARWFVEAARLPMDSGSAGVAGRDATGSPVQLLVVHGLWGRFDDGNVLPVETGVVAGFPAMFETARIGGLLNPQLLARDANAVVLDLRVPELRIESFDRAVRRLGATVLTEDDLEVCVSTGAAVPNRLFAIWVTAGDGAGWLQLDTGADQTSIGKASSLVDGVALEPGGTTMGVAGQPQTYDLARDLVLAFAGHSRTISAHVVERSGSSCGPDGLLGLDAVERCALVLGRNAVGLACSP